MGGLGPGSQNALDGQPVPSFHLALLQIGIFHIIIAALSPLPCSLTQLWLMMAAEDPRRLEGNVSCQIWLSLA